MVPNIPDNYLLSLNHENMQTRSYDYTMKSWRLNFTNKLDQSLSLWRCGYIPRD